MSITALQLSTFIFAVVVFMLTPGPGVFATIAKAMAHGAWSVLPLAIGLAGGDAVYMVLSAYGLSALASNYQAVFVLVTFLGAGYLFYLAYKMWVTVPDTPSTDQNATQTPRKKADTLTAAISGFLISFSNPKVILFYVSLLPSFFPVTQLTTLDILVLCVTIFVCAVVSMLGYALLASQAQKRLANPTALQRFNRIGSVLMAMAAVWLLAKG